MNKLSQGTRWAIYALLVITLMGVAYSFVDYTRQGDTSTIWWPIISAVITVIIYIGGRRTDGRATSLVLLLLAGGLYSCKPTETAQSEAKQEKQVALEIPTRTYTVDGYDQTEEDKREW